jgi:sulfate transport system substrate-binding protein
VAVVERTVAKKGTAVLAKAYLDYHSDEEPGDCNKRNTSVFLSYPQKYADTFKLSSFSRIAGNVRLRAKDPNDGGQFDKLYTVR